jgi:hypothetical protein
MATISGAPSKRRITRLWTDTEIATIRFKADRVRGMASIQGTTDCLPPGCRCQRMTCTVEHFMT